MKQAGNFPKKRSGGIPSRVLFAFGGGAVRATGRMLRFSSVGGCVAGRNQ